METISVLIGFLIGVVATMIAVEFGLKKIFRPPALNKITGAWRLADHTAPLVVTQDASGVPLPSGSRVVTAGDVEAAGFRDRDHRRNPNARSNFLVDPEMDRAMVFMGPIREGTLALATLDPAVAARLRAEHRRLWETGERYVDETPLKNVARRMGTLVRVRGRVQERVAYRDQHLLRLTDGDHVVGAIVEEPLELHGQNVVVTGRVVRGASGYPVLEAEEVRLEGGQRATAPTPPAPTRETDPPAEETAGGEPRVLRVRPRAAAEEAAPDAEEEELVAFEEEPQDVVTEAERRRRRARVTLHR